MLDPDDVLQLRVRVRAAGLRGQGRPVDQEGRGQPGPPRLARPQLRQGPGHDQPGQRPRADPAPAAARRRRAAAASGSRSAGTTRSTTSPAGSGRRSWRAAATRSCTTWAGPARTASPSGSSWPGASTGTTATPTSARRARGFGQTLWGGYDRPSPDYANAKVILLLSSHLETGHYFNPHAQRIMEGKLDGAQADRRRPADVQHRLARRPLDRAVAGQRGRDPAGDRLLPAAHPADRRRLPAALVQLGRLPGQRPPRDAARLRDLPRPAHRGLRAVHLRVRGGGGPGPGRADRGDGRLVAELRRPARRRTSGARRRPATTAAGRCRGRCGSCYALTGSIGTKGGTSPNGWDKFIPHGPNMPPADDVVERADLAGRVPDVDQRDVDPAAALPEGGPREARRLLLPGLQPDLDQPRRLHLDGGADRRRRRSACTSR